MIFATLLKTLHRLSSAFCPQSNFVSTTSESTAVRSSICNAVCSLMLVWPESAGSLCQDALVTYHRNFLARCTPVSFPRLMQHISCSMMMGRKGECRSKADWGMAWHGVLWHGMASILCTAAALVSVKGQLAYAHLLCNNRQQQLKTPSQHQNSTEATPF